MKNPTQSLMLEKYFINEFKTLVFAVSLMVFLISCESGQNNTTIQEKTSSSTQQTTGIKREEEARKAIKKMVKRGLLPAQSWEKLAIEQPEYNGILGEMGALVFFDSHKEPVGGQTLKKMDYLTGTRYEIRTLSKEDLAPYRQQLRDHFQQLFPNSRVKTMVIPIVSQSFRSAMINAVLNTDSNIRFSIERGTGMLKEELMVLKLNANTGKERLVASEAIFATKRNDY